MMHLTNVFMVYDINKIGGVESWLYYLSKKYKDRDITIFYGSGDLAQINRLKEYVRVVKYSGQDIYCERAFFNYSMFGVGSVKAKEYIYMIHADYKRQSNIRFTYHPKITRYIAVSEVAKQSFEDMYGIPVEVAYNPLDLDIPKKTLHLVSATRLTPEKGLNRMVELARMLRDKQIPYTWDVYTYDPRGKLKLNSIFFNQKQPSLNVGDYIADADYLVQLSDSESYCFAVAEALSLGVPVIVTDLDVFKELGFKSGVHGYAVPLDMMDIDIDNIYNNIPKFKPMKFNDRWGEILGDNKSTYSEEYSELVDVQCIRAYTDLEMDRKIKVGEKWKVSRERAEKLFALGVVR